MKKQYIVKVADVKGNINSLKHKTKKKSHKELQAHIMDLDDNEVAELRRDTKNIEYVEEDGDGKGIALPNDPMISSQWYLSKLKVTEAWDAYTSGSNTLIIAVCDSGLDFNHPEFAGKYIKGYDYVNSDADPADDHGHGTAVAGVIAANSNNSIGIAGVCPDCRLLIYKVLDSTNWGKYSNWALSIRAAADYGAKIINLSLGGVNSSLTLQSAVDYAWSKGCIIVVSAGNDGSTTPTYPAGCNNVVAVSSIDSNDVISGWSNRGPNIDICCYGSGIYTTHRGGGYATWSGTSFACPMICGVLGLLWSANRLLGNVDVLVFLYNSAVDLGVVGRDDLYGYGRPDVYAAITNIVGVTPEQEVWVTFTELYRDWYVLSDWSPSLTLYYTTELVTQTRTLARDWKSGERSNLGNERGIIITTETKTETRQLYGTKVQKSKGGGRGSKPPRTKSAGTSFGEAATLDVIGE